MIWAIIVCLGLAAAAGAYLISKVAAGASPPKGVAILHGVLAATGLVLLVIYDFTYTPAPIAATVVLGGAAVGGFILFGNDIRAKPVPTWLAVVHALAALTGFVLLLLFAFA